MGQGFAIIKDLIVIGIAPRDQVIQLLQIQLSLTSLTYKQSLKQRSEDNFQVSLGTKSKYEKQSFAQIV
ncbi:hypothetical protein L3X38_034776 [Prunus dulcis]|uniref:Uncharacterized protein n=1 Tax=Prunus dulcis TaxID=3755 RepID=A0AAD4YX73_PRUDU|nr:hypothetical protein L3X38_034776 [Prunus dulcis]